MPYTLPAGSKPAFLVPFVLVAGCKALRTHRSVNATFTTFDPHSADIESKRSTHPPTGKNTMNPVFTDWPMYQSHKFVRAIFIGEIIPNEGGALLTATNPAHEPIQVTHDFLGRHTPSRGGALVQYESGYLSYCPAEVFHAGNTLMDRAMSFGVALEALRKGLKVRRRGWNASGLYLEMQEPDEFSKMTLPYVYLNYPDDAKTTPGARVPWAPTQTDMLGLDWEIVE